MVVSVLKRALISKKIIRYSTVLEYHRTGPSS